MVVVAEHVLFLLRAIFSGLVDKVPRAVREAQAIIAVQQKQERREFRRLASGLPVSFSFCCNVLRCGFTHAYCFFCFVLFFYSL